MSKLLRLFPRIGVAAILLALTPALRAELILPSVFSDRLILQRDAEAPVWGWADPGEIITVALRDEKKSCTAGPDGKWRVRLDRHPAGGPFEITIAGKTTRRLQDVYFGEVWVCAGQSNMQMLFRTMAFEPKQDSSGSWIVCSPQTAGKFAAIPFFFGRVLHRKLNVPIGLLNVSLGGSGVEPHQQRGSAGLAFSLGDRTGETVG